MTLWRGIAESKAGKRLVGRTMRERVRGIIEVIAEQEWRRRWCGEFHKRPPPDRTDGHQLAVGLFLDAVYYVLFRWGPLYFDVIAHNLLYVL